MLFLLPPAAIADDEEADFGPAPAMEALLKLDMVSSVCVCLSLSVMCGYGVIYRIWLSCGVAVADTRGVGVVIGKGSVM